MRFSQASVKWFLFKLVFHIYINLSTLLTNSAEATWWYFFLFFQENRVWHCLLRTVCMKCQTLFSKKKKKKKKKNQNCCLLKIFPSMLRSNWVTFPYLSCIPHSSKKTPQNGIWQTGQTQIRSHRTLLLVRVYSALNAGISIKHSNNKN